MCGRSWAVLSTLCICVERLIVHVIVPVREPLPSGSGLEVKG